MANYPSSVSTNSNLYVAVNGIQTTLASAITNSVTTIPLTSTSGFPTTGYVTIENNEVVSYTGISGANLTGCTRGADGSTALAHASGVTVGLTIVAAHHNLIKDEVIAIETALGTNLSNVFPATATTGSGNVVLQTSPTLITPNLGTASAGVLTNATGLPLTTGVTGTLPNANTTATSAATGSTIVSRDASVNTKVNEVIQNFSTTVTAAGTTTLTVTSSPLQQFTGTTTQTVTLPDATTLSVGFYFTVLNRSTGAVTVNKNGGILQSSVPASTQTTFVCTNVSSAAGVWDASASSAASSGTVTNVSGTTNQITSTNPTTTPVLALANPLTLPGAMTAGGTIAMAANKITGLANGTAATDAAAYGQLYYGQQAAVQTSGTSNTVLTTSSYVDTVVSTSITPTSNTKRIKITTSFVVNLNTGTSTQLTLARGGINLMDVTGGAQVTTSGSSFTVTVFITWIDSPATTSNTTYTVRGINSNGSGSISIGNGRTWTIILEEIV